MSRGPSEELQVALLVDDMIDTGKTLTLAARTLHDRGAKTVYALISHGENYLFENIARR